MCEVQKHTSSMPYCPIVWGLIWNGNNPKCPLQVSLNVGNPPASTMFSYAVLNDDKHHAIELLLDGKNLTMRVDGGLARSLINRGSKVYLILKKNSMLELNLFCRNC